MPIIIPPANQVFFNDTFTGTGALGGHAPDISFSGFVWGSAGVSIAANAAVSDDQINTASFGSASYGIKNNSSGGPIYSAITAKFTTGASVSANAFGYKGLTVLANSGGNGYQAELYGSTGALWTLKITALATGETASASLGALAASTTYDLSFVIDTYNQQANASLKLTGTSLGDTGLISALNAAGYSPIGLTSLGFVIGATCSLDDLKVTSGTSTPNSVISIMAAPMGAVSATGSPGSYSFNNAPMGTLLAYGGGNASLTAPMGTLVAYGGGFIATAPMGTLVAYGGGNASLTAPMGALRATGHDSAGEYAFAGAAPMGTLLAFGGASARIAARMGTLSAAGTVTALGSAALTAPRPQLVATGTTAQMANSSEFLGPPMGTLVGYGGTLCSITGPMGTLQATGTVGGVGYATLVAPLFELTASGTAQNHGGADLLAPMGRLGATGQAWLIAPMGTLTAVGTAVVAISYEAYSVNLTRALDRNPSNQYDAQVDEVSRYTNFPFTAIVRYRNSYFGVAADGLYLLEGTTDAGTPIPYNVKTCKSDFGVPEQKTVSSAYFGGHLGAAETVTLFVGDQAPQAQSYTTPRGIRAQNHRQKFGKGNKTRYYALGVSGTAELELDTIDFEVDTMKRRI